MLGKRFLAILAVMALGAGSAMVGLTMASGQWNVVGTGLEPGAGYGVLLSHGQDRLKLELANTTSDPVAWVSVWTPDGVRAGFYQLDGSTKAAEVVANEGVWLLFVYKVHGGDLSLSVHGNSDTPAQFAPADVQRREVTLGSVEKTGQLDETYTAVLNKEPALAGVYLRGSARMLESELRTEKGLVEVVRDEVVSAAAAGVVVDSKGERTTLPQNLQAGPFTARVKAEEISGQLVLVTLYVLAPEFDLPAASPEEDGAPAAQAAPPGGPHGKRPHGKGAAQAAGDEPVACGTADSRTPYGLEVLQPALLRVALEEQEDPLVSVYDPEDQLLAVLELKEQGDTAEAMLMAPGEYVLYARGASVNVTLLHAKECKLRELGMEMELAGVIAVPDVAADEAKGSTNFTLSTPPLDFQMQAIDADTVILDGRAEFTGPEGVAGHAYMTFGAGLLGESGVGGVGGLLGGSRGHGWADMSSTQVNATGLVLGEWLVDFEASIMHGNVAIVACHYVREAAEDKA
jgi:hypothetical protein